MDHAQKHRNVQPGEFGRPFLPHDINTRQILCALHGAELNMAKVVPWKHGILNNSSDDARDKISNQLRLWQHPLDTRRKDNNRVASDKWFTGEHFISFLKGNRGSPGGPIAIATLVMIIADDLQNRGVMHGDGELEEAVAPAPAPAGARGGSRAQAVAVSLTGVLCDKPLLYSIPPRQQPFRLSWSGLQHGSRRRQIQRIYR